MFISIIIKSFRVFGLRWEGEEKEFLKFLAEN